LPWRGPVLAGRKKKLAGNIAGNSTGEQFPGKGVTTRGKLSLKKLTLICQKGGKLSEGKVGVGKG